jgi:ribosomal protein S11
MSENKDIKVDKVKDTKQPCDKIMKGIKSYKYATYNYKENKIIYYVDENELEKFIKESGDNKIKINKQYPMPTPTVTRTP